MCASFPFSLPLSLFLYITFPLSPSAPFHSSSSLLLPQQVNADIKKYIIEEHGAPRLFNVDTSIVGKTISTKALGSTSREDVTDQVRLSSLCLFVVSLSILSFYLSVCLSVCLSVYIILLTIFLFLCFFVIWEWRLPRVHKNGQLE